MPLEYDPMLAKVAAWAATREAAIDRMRRALSEYKIEGIRTNLAWFDEILRDESFRAGDLSTAFLENFRRAARESPGIEMEAVAAVVAALQIPKARAASSGTGRSAWAVAGREEMMR